MAIFQPYAWPNGGSSQLAGCAAVGQARVSSLLEQAVAIPGLLGLGAQNCKCPERSPAPDAISY